MVEALLPTSHSCNIVSLKVHQHLHVGVTNGSPSPLLRDLQPGHPEAYIVELQTVKLLAQPTQCVRPRRQSPRAGRRTGRTPDRICGVETRLSIESCIESLACEVNPLTRLGLLSLTDPPHGSLSEGAWCWVTLYSNVQSYVLSSAPKPRTTPPPAGSSNSVSCY